MCFALALLLALARPQALPVPPIPSDPGLYYLNTKGLTRIEGRPVSVSHGRKKIPLSGSLPVGPGNATSAEILGAHAGESVSATPVFFYRVPAGGESVGAGDLVMVKLKTRGAHRAFTISAEADWKESAGIPLRSQVQFNVKQTSSGIFRMEPADDLNPGEYGFYQFRGQNMPGLLYDFKVVDATP